MEIRCVVACTQSDGVPGFYICKVIVGGEGYDEGVHYDAAKEKAEAERYDGPMVVYDENDGPAWLFDHFGWDDVDCVMA